MSSINHGENIYDSKLNEERPKINKSLGKHQINNNLHMWTKMGAKIYKDDQPHIAMNNPDNMGMMSGKAANLSVYGR
jgi:hypothetical protein